jgi:hypothetical protein
MAACALNASDSKLFYLLTRSVKGVTVNVKLISAAIVLFCTSCAGATNTVFAQQSTKTAANLPASTRLALPGEQHRWLNPLVGTWAVEMLVWPAPGATPIVSKDLAATRSWTLGGRYLREELTGSFAGSPSERIAFLSYNNLEERFEMVTIDTFEPGQMWYVSQGKGSPSKLELMGENVEAGFGDKPTGRKRLLRFEFEILADRSIERIFVKYPGEKEYLFVEQKFTRARQ